MKIVTKLFIGLSLVSTTINIYAGEVTVCPASITCNGRVCTRPDSLSGSWKCAYRPSPRYPEKITLPWTSAHIRTLNHATCNYFTDGVLIVQCVARVNHRAIYNTLWSGSDNAVCTHSPEGCRIEMGTR